MRFPPGGRAGVVDQRQVVERDGLVLIGWMLGDTAVDTYVRLPEPAAATALVTAVQALTPEPATPTAEGIAS